MAKPRPKKPEPQPLPTKQAATRNLLIGFGALVAVALIVALVVAKPWESNESDDGSAPYRPVTVTGTALSKYPEKSTGATDTAPGTIAPTLSGATFTGTPVALKADGKAKVVMFFAHWCPHCQKELPLISDWLRANPNAGVDFFSVATGTNPTLPNYPPAKWFDKEKYPLPVMADDNASSAATAYGLSSYPYLVFLDGNNKVISRTAGEIPMDQFAQMVDSLKTAAAASSTASSTTTSTTAP
jgi:thiol-disulfide isomerase/thioredoxin